MKDGNNNENQNKESVSADIGFVLEPINLSSEKLELCNKLDKFYKNYIYINYKGQKPFDLIYGIYYAMRSECRSNLDWKSQAAHSARELVYPFLSRISKGNLLKLFRKYSKQIREKENIKTENRVFVKTLDNLREDYKELQDLAHHLIRPTSSRFKKNILNFSDNDFEKLIERFFLNLKKTLRFQQIFIHNIIDFIIQEKGKKRINRVKKDLKLVLGINNDAKNYFFSQATAKWLDMLWNNGFLDKIKQESKDPTQYSYGLIELNYITKVSEEASAKVTNLILSSEDVATNENNFNPEVVDRFTRIAANLPAKHLVDVVKKIKKEKWPKLMSHFSDWGFDYEYMFKTLYESKKYKVIIDLADVLLEVKSKDEFIEGETNSFSSPFYFNNLFYTKVFDYLHKIKDNKPKKVLGLISNKIKKIIELGDQCQGSKTFDIQDKFNLLEVDFFTAKLNKKSGGLLKDDVKDIFELFAELSKSFFKNKCEDKNNVETLYVKHIKTLPKSRVAWRLKLFTLSQCPGVFNSILKRSFFKIFDNDQLVKDYANLLSGSEYLKALEESFGNFQKKIQNGYINKIIQCFDKKYRNNEKEKFHLKYGSDILSIIKKIEKLSPKQEEKAKDKGFIIDESFKPKPALSASSASFARTVIPKGPISLDEFHNISIEEIVSKMKNEWTPESLLSKNKPEDYLKPNNAGGLGYLIRKDLCKRLNQYITKSNLFFDKDNIDAHYTYSFIVGVQEVLKNEKIDFDNTDWNQFLLFCSNVVNKVGEYENKGRERSNYENFRADWGSVNQVICEIVTELIHKNNKIGINFKENRQCFLKIINKLLKNPDPVPQEDKIETATMKQKLPGENNYIVVDPYTRAINSIRGKAFKAFVFFLDQDGKKLQQKIKNIYKNILKKEKTQPIMFLFGFYLNLFYSRDKKWIIDILDNIFPQPKNKNDNYDLFLASWEGFLSNNLYKDIFINEEIQALYKKAIKINPNKYTKRKYFRELDEGLAVHFALAFVHFEDFNFEHPLFKYFWQKGNKDAISEFIKFIGRKYISGEENVEGIDKVKIKNLWIKALSEKRDNIEALKQFGFWINVEKGIFKIEWLGEKIKETLELTNGLFKWGYNLKKSIVLLSEKAPEQTLQILKLYFLKGFIESDNQKRTPPPLIREDWLKAFDNLYKHESTKDETYGLISELIEKGERRFWVLENIIKD